MENDRSTPSHIEAHVEVSGEFLNFIDWLRDEDRLAIDGLRRLLEKPWNWQAEFVEYLTWKETRCPFCDGTGRDPVHHRRCNVCGGSGIGKGGE